MEEGGGDIRWDGDMPGMATEPVVLARIGWLQCGSQ